MKMLESVSDDREILKMAMRSIFDVKPDREPKEKPPSFLESVGSAISNAIASNPTLQNKLGEAVSATVETGSAIVSHLISPKPATPTAAPPQMQTQPPVSLQSLRRPRNDAEAAPTPENEPQTQATAENERSAPPVELETMPLIELE
jgi:hypothetical protein